MTTIEVAKRLVELVKDQKHDQAMDELYHPEIISIEPVGDVREVQGIDACKKKGEGFSSMFDVNGSEVLGPYPHDDKFTVHYNYDVTAKEGGHRFNMMEIALYQVKDGKIVWEKFFYDIS
ncbi:MAG: nuclear transport factor 2 family protein [Armatimonadota bacterium]